MSITFMIDNGIDYIRNNKPELIEKTVYSCQCVDFSEDGKAYPDCFHCQGKGEVSFENFPFELNVANANASTILNSLGIEFDYCGEIDPRTLLKAINRTPAELMHRQTTEDNSDGCCHIIHCGIVDEQANYYLNSLKEIAEEAERREEKIYWC